MDIVDPNIADAIDINYCLKVGFLLGDKRQGHSGKVGNLRSRGHCLKPQVNGGTALS